MFLHPEVRRGASPERLRRKRPLKHPELNIQNSEQYVWVTVHKFAISAPFISRSPPFVVPPLGGRPSNFGFQCLFRLKAVLQTDAALPIAVKSENGYTFGNLHAPPPKPLESLKNSEKSVDSFSIVEERSLCTCGKTRFRHTQPPQIPEVPIPTPSRVRQVLWQTY